MSKLMRSWLLGVLVAVTMTFGVSAQDQAASTSPPVSLYQQVVEAVASLLDLLWPESLFDASSSEEEPPVLEYGPGAEPVG